MRSVGNTGDCAVVLNVDTGVVLAEVWIVPTVLLSNPNLEESHKTDQYDLFFFGEKIFYIARLLIIFRKLR